MLWPLTLYGATDCDDTQRTRHQLQQRGVAFEEINIDQDAPAERFVIFINHGYRSTPTLVLGAGKVKLVVTEPDDEELERLLHTGAPFLATLYPWRS